jgi:DNA-binding transcriptional LysR family regulator
MLDSLGPVSVWYKTRPSAIIRPKMIQMREAVETSELVAFVRVADARSLSRAEEQMAVPRATIARRIARLEQRLGTRLLRRTTRSLSLTDAGETFYRHARSVLEAVARAEASVTRTDHVVRGELRVSVPPMPFEYNGSFSELLTSFAKRYPEVRVQVDVTTRLVDLMREGYDVALRASSQLQPGLVARIVGRHRAIAVAAPDYLAERGTPRSAKDLRRHRCLTGFARGELPMSTWPVGGRTVHIESVFSCNDVSMLRDAALQGLGIAFLPEAIVADQLVSGALVQVLAGVLEAENKLAVVYVEREFMPPQVRAFVDELVAWAPTLGALSVGRKGRLAREARLTAGQRRGAPRRHR